MAFKIRRQSRKMRLISIGFLPFEAQTLSAVEFKVPYVKKMMIERKALYEKAINEGWTRKQLEEVIMKRYKDNEWVVKDTATKRTKTTGNADPWLMLKKYRDDYITAGLPYDRPKKKHRKKKRVLDDDKVVPERKKRRQVKGLRGARDKDLEL